MADIMKRKECPLCRSDKLQKRAKISIIRFRIVNLIQCLNCSSYFVDPLPNKHDIKKMYTDDYYYSNDPTYGFSNFLKGALSHLSDGKYFGKKLSKIKKKGRMLDYGCGTGFILKGIELTSNWNVYGVEIPDMAVKFAKEVLKLKVTKGDNTKKIYKNNFFDYIYCSQVLEHTIDPINKLKEFYRILNKNGTLFLSLPNGICDAHPIISSNKNGIIPKAGQPHLFFFSPAILAAIMKDIGFTIQKAYTRNIKSGLIDLGILPKKKIKKLFNKQKKNKLLKPKKYNKSKETKENYKIYKEKTDELINIKNIKTSMIYASYKDFKKNLYKLPLSLPFGHCLEIIAKKK